MVYQDKPLMIMLTFFVFWIGACFGSFLNVCIWRIPRGESIVHPPSHCPKCNYKIPTYLNVPIFAWLILRGRCASCKVKIPPRYILMEIATAFLFLGIWVTALVNYYPFEIIFAWFGLVSLLICCGMIDLDLRIIPNKITKPGMIIGLLFSVATPAIHFLEQEQGIFSLQSNVFMARITSLTNPHLQGLVASLLGILVGYFFLKAFIEVGKLFLGKKLCSVDQPQTISIKGKQLFIGELEYDLEDTLIRSSDKIVIKTVGEKTIEISSAMITVDGEKVDESALTKETTTEWIIPREIMGYGDAKMIAMIGAFLGAELIFFVLLVASFMALSSVALMSLFGLKFKKTQIPFGSFIALGTYLLLAFS